MNALVGVATSFGLSAAAGLNAYLPLLIVALMARFTDLIVLQPPYDVLTSWWAIAILAVLALIEAVVDKVPAVDSANDVVQTAIRPAAGAVLFASNANLVSEMHPALALACGLLVAGGVHAAKATVRPVVTGATAGLLNPVVSFVEDVVSVIVTILAIVVPLLLVALIVLTLGFVWWRRRRAAQAKKSPSG